MIVRGVDVASIIVVGGGVAGLACAWRLARAGHAVEVLELERQPGGRLRSEPLATELGPFSLPNGASFFTSGQQNVESVLTALGLGPDVIRLDRAGASDDRDGSVPGAVVRGDRLERCDAGRPFGQARGDLLPVGSRVRSARLEAELVRRRGALDPLHPELSARREDGLDALRFASRVAGRAACDRFVVPVLEVALGCEPEDVSSAFALLAIASLRRGAAPLALRGGLSRLVDALSAPVVVRGGCEVFGVETEAGGARVDYVAAGRPRSVVADAVVVAVPASLVPVLCPKLSPHERGFFESVRYAPAMHVHLMLERPPGADALAFATGFARGAGGDLRAVFQGDRVAGTAPPGRGLLTVALSERAVRRLANASDEDIAQTAVAALSRTPLLRACTPAATRVHRWHAARPLFGPGALSWLESFGLRIDRSPRLAFAGDYLVAPTVEGALTSGINAAWRVVQSLDRIA